MRVFYQAKSLFLLVFIAVLTGGCQTTVTTNTNSNANLASGNRTVTNGNLNSNSTATTSSATIDTREPDQYQAKVTIKLEAMGEQQQPTGQMPTLSANVARNGDARRMEFALPGGEKAIYLDKGGQSLLIMPNRKQVAELNKESTGFDVRRLMMPEQIVRQVQSLKGLEKVGEEMVNGRTVIRYRYGAVTNTKSEAGQVNTESSVLVDKETSLPLRSETVAEASGNVKLKGLRIITEMSDLQTTAPADLFVEPADYQKVPPEQVRAQVNTLFQVAAALLGSVMQNAQTTASPAASPAMSPMASPAVSPAQ